MSLKSYYGMVKDLQFNYLELINFEYIRILFSDSALSEDFIHRFNNIKEQIKQSTNVDVTAEVVGRHKTAVIIDGMGMLYERNIEAFETVKRLIMRYTSNEASEASVKQVLQVSKGRRTTPSATPAPTVTYPAASKTAPAPTTAVQKHTAPKKAPSHDGDGDIDGILFSDDVERLFSEHIVQEEVETCQVMITRAAENFKITDADAKTKLDAWAKKNTAEGNVEYDPNYGDGEGLVRIL